jgi:predicted rRNA methylase YqxC with S4 and FtsJ domains
MLPSLGFDLIVETESPIRGKAGNREFLWRLATKK